MHRRVRKPYVIERQARGLQWASPSSARVRWRSSPSARSITPVARERGGVQPQLTIVGRHHPVHAVRRELEDSGCPPGDEVPSDVTWVRRMRPSRTPARRSTAAVLHAERKSTEAGAYSSLDSAEPRDDTTGGGHAQVE